MVRVGSFDYRQCSFEDIRRLLAKDSILVVSSVGSRVDSLEVPASMAQAAKDLLRKSGLPGIQINPDTK